MASQVQIPFDYFAGAFCPHLMPDSEFCSGEKISTKGDKGSVKRAKDESANGLQGVGKDSKEIREGRRTLRFSTNAQSIIEPVSFLCNSFSSCLSCLSCVSMFNDAANRINGTWPLLPIGIRTRCFTRVCSASQGGGPTCLNAAKPDPFLRGTASARKGCAAISIFAILAGW